MASRLGPETLLARRPARSPGARAVAETATSPVVEIRSWPREAIPPAWGPRGLAPSTGSILDRRLVDGLDAEFFAYKVTAAATKHLRGVAAPGDRVVLRRHGGVTPDRICAIRTERGIVLSRALVKEGSILLLPGEGEVDFESVELRTPPGSRTSSRERTCC